MRSNLLLLTAIPLLCTPGIAEAQAGSGAIEVSAGWGGWTGADLERIDAGPIFQATLWTGTEEALKLGLSGSYARSGIEGADDHLSEFGLGLTARQSFGPPETAQLHLEAYAGWSRLSMDISASDFTLRENGFSVGPGAALSLTIFPRLRLLTGAGFRWHRYRDLYFGLGPVDADGSDSGWRWHGRLGISWILGS